MRRKRAARRDLRNARHIVRGLLGIAAILVFAWAISEDRFRVPWRVVAIGVLLQFALALLFSTFSTPVFSSIFAFAIFAVGNFSEDLRSFAIAANDADWDGMLTFLTRSAGELTASRRKIFIHTLLHGVRHWAQLSTHLRQKGYKQDWMHDFLASGVIK